MKPKTREKPPGRPIIPPARGNLSMNITPGKGTRARVDIMKSKNRAYNPGNRSA